MAIGDNINNPGDLLYGTPWSGVTGGYTSPNGLKYAVFSTPQAGLDALVTDIKAAIGHGYTTLASFVYHYLGTSTNNKANANVAGYLATVEKVTGLSASSTLTPDSASLIAKGIATAEGTATHFADLFGGATGTGAAAPATGNAPTSSTVSLTPTGGTFLGLNWGNVFAVMIGAGLLLVAIWAITNTSKTAPA